MAERADREQFAKKHPNVTARETPNSYEAEVALLGGMLIDTATAAKFMPQLGADDFYTPGHKYLYEAMRDLFVKSEPIDFVTVVGVLEGNGTIELAGGVEYVSGLVNAVPSVANSDYYFGLVKKHTRLRALIGIARQMADEAYALDPDDKALAHAEAALYSLAETGSRTKLTPVAGSIAEALADIQKRQENRDAYRGVPTGFSYFDMILGGGFQKSDLIILAARPGQGKTTFAMNCAVNAALASRPDNKKPYTVAVFSLEMSAVQLAKRMLCSVGNVSMSDTNRAMVDAVGWSKLYEAQNRLNPTRLFIDESGDITPAEVLSKCRSLKHSGGLDFIMIDYLQLMQSGRKLDNFVREIAEITRALKLAAKELDVPILLLSQMSRDIDKRKDKDKSAQLSDLRDSGAIEQDADIVLFLERTSKEVQSESTDNNQTMLPANTVFLNVAKHRNGETGSVRLMWVPSTLTFKCVDSGAPEPPRQFSGMERNANKHVTPQYSAPMSVENAPQSGDDEVFDDIDVDPDDVGL